MWDIAKRTDTVKLLGHQARVTCLSYDMAGSTTLLTGSEDTRVKYWDVRSGKAINTFKEHSSKVNSVQFSPDSRWAASGADDGSLKIWELSSGKVLFNVAFP
jgi:WD40 repeat protein